MKCRQSHLPPKTITSPSEKRIEYSRVANKKYAWKKNVGDHSKFIILLCCKSIRAVRAAAARLLLSPWRLFRGLFDRDGDETGDTTRCSTYGGEERMKDDSGGLWRRRRRRGGGEDMQRRRSRTRSDLLPIALRSRRRRARRHDAMSDVCRRGEGDRRQRRAVAETL